MLVYGIWYMVYMVYMVYGIWYMVYGICGIRWYTDITEIGL